MCNGSENNQDRYEVLKGIFGSLDLNIW